MPELGFARLQPAEPPAEAPRLQPCEYRQERPRDDDPGATELVCLAMGGKPLGRKGRDDERILKTCNACSIPQEAAFRPCLFLVPFKTERDGKPRDYFACRWFYRLKYDDPYKRTRYMCEGCPYWFPAPPIELLRDLESVVRKMIAFHQEAWVNPPQPLMQFNWTPREAPPRTPFQRIWRWITRWWW